MSRIANWLGLTLEGFFVKPLQLSMAVDYQLSTVFSLFKSSDPASPWFPSSSSSLHWQSFAYVQAVCTWPGKSDPQRIFLVFCTPRKIWQVKILLRWSGKLWRHWLWYPAIDLARTLEER